MEVLFYNPLYKFKKIKFFYYKIYNVYIFTVHLLEHTLKPDKYWIFRLTDEKFYLLVSVSI